MIDELIAQAKGWRGLGRLTVLVVDAQGATSEVVVALGDTRRRWKRVAAALAPIADSIVGARGYDAKGALVGGWDVPDDATDDDEPEETDAMAAHRQHTQWVLRESAKMHEGITRLCIELVSATIEIVKRNATPQPSAPAVSDDDASKTLQMLLGAAMANNNGRTDDAEVERVEERTRSDAGGQGPAAESSQARP